MINLNFVLIIVISYLVYINIIKRCNFTINKKTYTVSYINNGKWYKNIIYTFLKTIYNDNIILNENDFNSDYLIVTHKTNINKLKSRNYKYLIGVSGESSDSDILKLNPNIIFNSYISNDYNRIWFPYILTQINNNSLNKALNINYTDINKRKHFLVYASKNCTERRNNFFKLIQKYSNNRGHSIGECLNNYNIPNRKDFTKNDKIYQNYKFVIAFENIQKKGYITEKLWYALLSGAIPIYWGCSYSAQLFFNKDSYIDRNDFKTDEDCIKYVLELEKKPYKMKTMQNNSIFKDNMIPDMFRWFDKKSNYHKKITGKLRHSINKHNN